MRRFFVGLAMLFVAGTELSAAETVGAAGREGVEAMLRAEEPYIAKARATYPKAKKRYLAGLPRGQTFHVRKRVAEPGTHQTAGALIEVESIKDGKIQGRIAGDTNLPSFRKGRRLTFPESDIMDWAILHPDGKVEGDFIGKYLEKAQSSYTNDLALSSADIAKIKRICHQFIGVPFEDATNWMKLAPYIRTESDLYQPITTCNKQYCSGGLRLRDDSQFLYTYLHLTQKGKTDTGDITPDRGQKGNNRFVGVVLVRHGKTILSEGHVDQDTIDTYLSRRDSSKTK